MQELLPEARQALERHGIEHRVVETTGIEHGCVEARMAAAAGEVVVVMSGDGLSARSAARWRTPVPRSASCPGGRGNDFARVLGDP